MRIRFLPAVFLSAMLFFSLAGGALGQYYWLYNDGGTPCGYATFPTSGFIWAEKFHPSSARTRIDSVKFAVYRYSGATATLTFKIHLYEDDGTVTSDSCPGGAVECDAVGTEVWVSGNMTTPAMTAQQWFWFTFNVADCTFWGDFIVGIEVAQAGDEPSLMMDCEFGPDCCYNFYRYQGEWREHWDLWNGPDDIGYNMIRAFVTALPPPPPPPELSDLELWFGHVDISYDGESEVVQDSLGITNPGWSIFRIVSVTTTHPMNFIFDANEVLGYIYPGETKWLHIAFTTTISEPTVTSGDLIVTYNGGEPDTCRMSGQGFGGHWLENFVPYPEPHPGPARNGEWFVQGAWSIFSDFGCANASAVHKVTTPDSLASDMLCSPPIKNPNHAGVKLRWANFDQDIEGDDFRALYWTSPNDTMFHFVTAIAPTIDSEWTEVGPYWVIADSDSVMLAFFYSGDNAHTWAIDDIRVDTLPGAPTDLTISFNPNLNRIELRWTGTGAPFFNVYRSLTDPFTDFAALSATSDTFFFDLLDAVTMAFYRVTASSLSLEMSACLHASDDAVKTTSRPVQLREVFPRLSP
ncbi:MAG: hypothetical protein FJY66_02600 [Calditrichaeota bacterium]|nr:hypothetical protein [Calditrichota bacterium]